MRESLCTTAWSGVDTLTAVSVRADRFGGRVLRRTPLSAHLVRLVLSAPGWTSTGTPDEWVALTVPGQFQTRYYTVRAWDPAAERLTLDVVVHAEGLVTGWAQQDCVGDEVGISAPKGSFRLPANATWLVLVGDLTALPAVARIAEETGGSLPVRAWVESPDGEVPAYLPEGLEATWLDPPEDGSGLADLVAGMSWPQGDGYLWMAGESAQMRAIRRHVRRDLGWPTSTHDLMGYWSNARGRQARRVDPGPIYARGKALGHTDEQIWAAYDAERDAAEGR